MDDWFKSIGPLLGVISLIAGLIIYVIRAEVSSLRVRVEALEKRIEAGLVNNPTCVERMAAQHRELRLEMKIGGQS